MGVGLGVINLVMIGSDMFALANVLAFFVAVTWNFFLNRRYTFIPTNKALWRQWFEFVVACLGGALLNWTVSMGLYYGLTFFTYHYNYAALLGVAVAAAMNFLSSKFYVFSKT
jgi:putative flippase GtrA